MLRRRGVIWTVKGIFHPKGFLTAMPRYVIKDRNDEERIHKLGLKDVADLHRAVLELGFDDVLGFNACAGRVTPLIPLGEIEAFYDPFKPSLCEMEGGALPCKILDYLSSILDSCKVGITGSSYFTWRESRDIDVLVFINGDNAESVLETIKRQTQPLSWSEALDLLLERGYPEANMELLSALRNGIGTRKIYGYRVFIRVLLNRHDEYLTCNYRVLKDGEVTLIGEVVDSGRSELFPYMYMVRVLKSDSIKVGDNVAVVSERGRFSGLAREGALVKIRGDYELMFYDDGVIDRQVYLWSKLHYIHVLAKR